MGVLDQILIGLTNELGDELSTPLGAKTVSSSDTKQNRFSKAQKSPLALTKQESSQVVQISPLPLTLKLSEYQNAYSNTNPGGDMFAALKFQQLVDSAPELNHEYITSLSSIEKIYGQIIKGVTYERNNTYLANLIAKARYRFDTSAQAEFVGNDEWRVIEAVPSDWYKGDQSRYKKIKIALNDKNQKANDFGLLNNQSSTTTLTIGGEQTSLSKATQFTHCELEYMFVRFTRPWMDYTLFETDGWWLTGQKPGYCSSGRKDVNSGILPLITTGMILVKSAQFEGDWDPIDLQKINDSHKNNKEVYVGPYKLASHSEAISTVSIAAWISELVPLSPQHVGTPKTNAFHFNNKGQYKAICIVKWSIDGVQMDTKSIIMTNNSDKIEVPEKAMNIIVIIRAMEGSEKKVVFRKKYALFLEKSYIISGLYESVQVNEE